MESLEGTATIVFTDVEGSTELTTSQGDEVAQGILRAHRELIRGQIEEHGGQEINTAGDGFMVAFASARRAVACSVGIQKSLLQQNLSELEDRRVKVRIGLHTGEVVPEEGGLFGEAINAAARVAAKAKGGEILISDTVRSVLGHSPEVELVDRGRFRLKGFPERWRLFEVVWRDEASGLAPAMPERTPFVGREREREQLWRLLDSTSKGHGALVVIGGEPGVGKTRLAEEVMAEARQRDMVALIGRCYEMEGSAPYIPFVEMVETAVRTFSEEAMRDALGDSASEIAKLMPELRRTFPDIPSSPRLPPDQERRYLFNATVDFIARASQAQSSVLVVDDLQWADESTLLLLQHIAQRLHEMPVLVIGTYRDADLVSSRPLARVLEELVRRRLVKRVALERLPESGVSAMIEALGGKEPPQRLLQVVYDETEGNPFFVEEVFQHLAEEGKLFDEHGGWRTDLEVSEVDVPQGVRLVLERRLARLSDDCRIALTAAAIIGRSFELSLVRALPGVVARRYCCNALRHFEPADEDELVRVWLASTIPGQDFLSEEYWRSQEPLVREHFIPIADTWIVEQDGELVAFMSILDHTIGGLFTHPDHQGKGYGRVLVKHARTLHENARVEVFRANVRAMAFYESCGFVEESSRLDEATGLEAVIMWVDGLRPS